MTKRIVASITVCLAMLTATAWGASLPASSASRPHSYAIYSEYARTSNKLMKNGLNRRVFNKVEAHSGADIKLNSDGSITLRPGTYRIQGFSITTMQTTFAPPVPQHNTDYPGYALVYPVADENAGQALLQDAIAIGSPQTALYTTPSIFDTIYKTKTTTKIAVGHQSGDDLNNEVYLSVYEVSGVPSNYHIFAQISITKM